MEEAIYGRWSPSTETKRSYHTKTFSDTASLFSNSFYRRRQESDKPSYNGKKLNKGSGKTHVNVFNLTWVCLWSEKKKKKLKLQIWKQNKERRFYNLYDNCFMCVHIYEYVRGFTAPRVQRPSCRTCKKNCITITSCRCIFITGYFSYIGRRRESSKGYAALTDQLISLFPLGQRSTYI